jgi:dethiobiotin synthetase
MNKVIIAGIGTGVGKTMVSALLVETFQADYWKPIQSGEPGDRETVRELTKNKISVFHPEAYRLSYPASPHLAASMQNITIEPEKINVPATQNNLVIELAGGLMVPLNDSYLNIDLIKKINAPVLLVSMNYLGSINHTLLSWHLLKSHNIPVKGIIFTGRSNPSSEDVILKQTQLPCLLKIPFQEKITADSLKPFGEQLKHKFSFA